MDKYAITHKTYNTTAQQFQDKFMNLSLYHNSYDALCSLLPTHANILDVGCGPGNITRYFLQKLPSAQILGIDVSPRMIELAKHNNPTAQFTCMDCREIHAIQTTFDALLFGFCFPYLSQEDILEIVADSASLLCSKGYIYISTMEDDYSKSGYETTSFSGEHMVYVHYHTAEFLTNALHKHGFSIVSLTRQDYPEQNGSISTDLIIIAQKL